MSQTNNNNLALRNAQIARRSLLESTWNRRLTHGITVGERTLRCEESDRNAFSQLLVMLAEAERLGQLPTTIPITDRTGQIHMLSVPDLRLLLLAYGNAYQSLWTHKAQYHAAIEQAETVEAVNQISINFP
jgi:hypothetical protein